MSALGQHVRFAPLNGHPELSASMSAMALADVRSPRALVC